eukprot:TRINITY_DN3621_c0_g1_i1.p1 TRINITY_DN3621_c0_g1~~TRINITY_DN3621_c0_g1_i1.p1  ORF type:complete len:572 (+),score=163.73 TRINITY_DN3621_c0_g1_i1:194-1909(+)
MFNRKKKDEDRKPIEQEIAELQRKFRVLENDKRACSEDSQGTIRKQRATIEKLTRENRKMKAELTETKAVSGHQADAKMQTVTLSKLNDQKEVLSEKIEGEAALSQQIQVQLDEAGRRISQLREEMAKAGGLTASMDSDKVVNKQIRILENRLDKGLQKFNESIAANRVLREQIDTLRRERIVFDDIYRKLESELQAKKKEMASIIAQANDAYEARDTAQAQMAALKQQADKEHAEFEKEWRELGRLIENDKRMKEFMRTKVRGIKEESETVVKDEEKHRKKITKNAWDTAKSLVTITTNQEKVAKYEDAFARIQAATGICDIDQLVQNFLDAEDTNFSLFKFNNELSADMEKLEQRIAELTEEQTILKGESKSREHTEKVRILENLKGKQKDIEFKTEQYQRKYDESKDSLREARPRIESIFRRLDLTAEDLPIGVVGDLVMDRGESAPLTEGADASADAPDHDDMTSNIVPYLAVIESRVDRMLRVHDSTKDDVDSTSNMTLQGRRDSHSAAGLQIKLPSTIEDHSDDEDDDDNNDDSRPFTRDELKEKSWKHIGKTTKKSASRTPRSG